MLIARADLPVNTLQEFIAYAKANRRKMQFGSSRRRLGSHLACARVNAAIGMEPTHIPYRGSGQAMQDLAGGRIDYFCALGRGRGRAARGQDRQGHRRLARERSPLFPDIPSSARTGLARRRSLFLERLLLSERHACRRSSRRLHEAIAEDAERYAGDAGAAEEDRRQRRRDGPPLGRLPQDVCRRGDRAWAATIKASGVGTGLRSLRAFTRSFRALALAGGPGIQTSRIFSAAGFRTPAFDRPRNDSPES